MKKFTCVILISLCSVALQSLYMAASAQVPKHEIVKIWPDGAPNDNFVHVSEADSLEWNVVDTPVLRLFPATESSGKVILMCPGGGYRHIGIQNEGYSFVPWYNRQGIDVAILQYRMPYGNPDVPLSDVHQSMRILRNRFPGKLVGIQGFSAGGHLASMAATHYTDSITRPDFQILYYPVIAVSGPNAHVGSSQRLLGENPKPDQVELYNNHLQVTPDTPQAFILHSSDDSVVPVANSLEYYSALVRNGVPASMHIYPIGGHGWGFYDGFKYKPVWSAELEYWLLTLENR